MRRAPQTRTGWIAAAAMFVVLVPTFALTATGQHSVRNRMSVQQGYRSTTAEDALLDDSLTSMRIVSQPQVIGSGIRFRYSEPSAHGAAPRHNPYGERAMPSSTRAVDDDGELVDGIPPAIAPPSRGELVEANGPEMIGPMGVSEYGHPEGCGCGGCVSACCRPRLHLDNFSVFGGVQGFTGPPNRGSTGSFGFHEGFNFGDSFPCSPCGALGWQLGARFTQNNFSGADYTLEQRNQTFITAGIFRRVDWGLQGGVAFDWLHENWYYQADLGQVRGEISWMYPCRHEFGFWFATATMTDQVTAAVRNANNVAVNVTTNWTPTDLYAIFYRRRFGDQDTSYARVYAGFSGESDGLIGADGFAALNSFLGFQTGFTYLIPDQAKGAAGNLQAGPAQEGWNITMSVIWFPNCGGAKAKNYYRPLFNVADNGSFMIDRK